MSDFNLICAEHWKDYELIDSGGFEKLERFGPYIISRPEPQACWNKSLSDEEWKGQAHAVFVKSNEKDFNADKGKWVFQKKMPESWFVSYAYKEMKLTFRLALTAFKHLGLFPEQADNWNYIYNTLKSAQTKNAQVLNLFAYTGGASLAAKAAGADVTHVDSVKQVVSWSKENMEASGLDNIRWIVDDALKFVKREARRGNKYHGIILDPPAYGRGPDGEKWVLEDGINELIKTCAEIRNESQWFVILNLYSMGFSALVADNLVSGYFGNQDAKEYGELFVEDHFQKKLPLGTFLRMKNF
jgi:23S rRNA (cytosine1962-C5)-methyltransferase